MLEFIKKDYNSNRVRFIIETLAWIMSIGANVLFAVTVPHVPFAVYLTITVTGCAMYAWSAYDRKSCGMLANYLFLTALDSFALAKVLV